ncbi:MAG TPA: DoxX family protein [Chloroflexota bacterium]|nr:DoxX family protein [Chloroflexota bacterium]
MNLALWIVQGLLAALFLFGGFVKLAMSAEELAAVCSLPVLFVRFISVCELLGGLGLILPGIFKIRTELTPLAAAGLTIITLGATGLTAAGVDGADPVTALFPLTAALLSAFVAYGRWRLVPLAGSSRPVVAPLAH